VAREIQNVCFASYPPELLARMSGQKGPVPDAVRSDPRLQLDYLKHEDAAAMGLFYPSLLDDLIPALQSAIRPGRRFLDLGSGDGRVVFLAAHLGADATGIEYEPTLDRLARRARGRLSHLVPVDHARLLRGDFFQEDFSRYDVLFYYAGYGTFLEKPLIEKIARELRDGAVAIITHVTPNEPRLTPVAAYGAVRVYQAASRPEAAADLAAVARDIQNACFAEYPPDLLARMTGRTGPVPDEVRSDPPLQIKYLKTEDVTGKGLFYPSLLDDLLPALQAEVRPGRRLLDLGSGDGRVVFLAAYLGADATGIEFERELDHLARRASRRLAGRVPVERARFRRGDFLKEDFSKYDVLFYYAHGSYLEQPLLEKIAREMREDAVALISFKTPPTPGLEVAETYGDVRAYRRVRDRQALRP
jgi:SAM-dependent methyltransferase